MHLTFEILVRLRNQLPAQLAVGESPAATRWTYWCWGPLRPGIRSQPTVGAMGVTDGRIVALGSADELAGLRSSTTAVVDSGDGTIIPGLIEPHMHLWSTGLFYDWEDCSHSSNPRFDDVVARLKAAADKAQPGEWVCGQLFDPSLLPRRAGTDGGHPGPNQPE